MDQTIANISRVARGQGVFPGFTAPLLVIALGMLGPLIMWTHLTATAELHASNIVDISPWTLVVTVPASDFHAGEDSKVVKSQSRFTLAFGVLLTAALAALAWSINSSRGKAVVLACPMIEFDPYDLVEDLIKLLSPIAARKDLALACVVQPPVPLMESHAVTAPSPRCSHDNTPVLAIEPARTYAPIRDPKAAPRRKLHFLVAEDSALNQFVTEETLKMAGFTCQIVGDGKQAVEASARGGFDAILMDCQMPVMDGFEATRAIRQREALSNAAGSGSRRIPIIALTAEAIQGDRQKCLAAEMDGYVTKPIDSKELFEEIQMAFKAAATTD